MSNKTFDTLRFIEAILVPLITFVTALTEIWGFEHGVEIAATLAGVNVAFGAILERLRQLYNKRIAEIVEDEYNGFTD